MGAGKVGGLFLVVGEFAAEVFVLEPAVQGGAAHFGEAGGLGDGGGGGEDGQGVALAGGELGIIHFCSVMFHFVP